MNIPIDALQKFGTQLALDAFRADRISRGHAKIASAQAVVEKNAAAAPTLVRAAENTVPRSLVRNPTRPTRLGEVPRGGTGAVTTKPKLAGFDELGSALRACLDGDVKQV